ncbi:MAG: hypothetical protein FE834_06940 [Gammaproteobacteria bacterium]|nr:hypothetical protein [Gammaproteobacteria bacterium]
MKNKNYFISAKECSKRLATKRKAEHRKRKLVQSLLWTAEKIINDESCKTQFINRIEGGR